MILRPIAALVGALMLADASPLTSSRRSRPCKFRLNGAPSQGQPARRNSSGGAIFMTTTSTAMWTRR